jgi:hypothetical protein
MNIILPCQGGSGGRISLVPGDHINRPSDYCNSLIEVQEKQAPPPMQLKVVGLLPKSSPLWKMYCKARQFYLLTQWVALRPNFIVLLCLTPDDLVNPLSCIVPWCTVLYYFTLSNARRFYSWRGEHSLTGKGLIGNTFSFNGKLFINKRNNAIIRSI